MILFTIYGLLTKMLYDVDGRKPPKYTKDETKEKNSPKRNPPLAHVIALSEVVKGHWSQEGYEGPLGTRGQTVFRPSAYLDLQSLGLTGSEEKSDSSFVSTLCPPSRIGPSMQVF